MRHRPDPPGDPDLILRNGAILTMQPDGLRAEALAVSGNSILAVGDTASIEKLAKHSTRVIDLGGRTVVPGFIDAHAHMDREGLKEFFPSLAGARSIKDIQQRIADEVASRPAGSWIVTMPIGEPPHYFEAEQGLAERRWPNRWDLDAAAPEHPVYIRAPWGFWHKPPIVSIANSRALEMCGITARSKPPISSITIDIDERRGEPNGIFREDHFFPLVELTMLTQAPRFSHADRLESLRRAMARYTSMGITSIYEGHGLAPELVDVYRDLKAEEMQVRCYLVQSAPWESAAEAERFCRETSGKQEDIAPHNPWIHLDGIYLAIVGHKEVNDVLRDYLPYTGWAGFLPQLFDEQEYLACADLAMQHDIRLNTIDGNKSDLIVEMWASLAEKYPQARQRRHAISHLRQPSAATLQRIKELGFATSTEAYGHLFKDAAKYVNLPEEEQEILPHRFLVDYEIPFALETDNCPPNPFTVMWGAVTRLERTSGAALGPRQRVSKLEALRAMTVGGAYLCGVEDRLGILAPGKLADLVVLEEDFLALPDDQLRNQRPLGTMVGGKMVYAAPGNDLGAE